MPWHETAVTKTAPASGGRHLDVLVSGPEDGLPLVFHNGTPGGLTAYEPMIDAAAERNLRTVMYARPGYGTSPAQPGRKVADAAADTAAVLDDLGATRFVTIGWSGGGPHALACAALLPGRCQGAVTMAGAAPSGAVGLDFLAGMAPENVTEFTTAQAGPKQLAELLSKQAAALREITPAKLVEGIGDLASAVDREALTGPFAEYLAASFRAALSGGTDGWRDDDLAFMSDWGFQLGGAPVSVWQGDQDMMVPLAHGQWLAAHVPGAQSHILPGVGHLSLVSDYPAILDDLLAISGIHH